MAKVVRTIAGTDTNLLIMPIQLTTDEDTGFSDFICSRRTFLLLLLFLCR